MSGKKTILVVSLFCLIAALLVIGLWVNQQSKAEEGPRKYIWGYVTYEASTNYRSSDKAELWDDERDSLLMTASINVQGSDTLYKGLHPFSLEDGWYWVKGEGLKANSGYYHVYFTREFDIRQDIYMSPKEPNK